MLYSIFMISYSTNLLRLWLKSIKWRLYFISYQFACYSRQIQNNSDIDKTEVYFSLIQKEDKWSRATTGVGQHPGSRLLTPVTLTSLSHILCLVLNMKAPSSTSIPGFQLAQGEWEKGGSIFFSLRRMNQILYQVSHRATLNCCCCKGYGKMKLLTDHPCDLGFPHSSFGKESVCNAGDPGSIPGSGRSPGEGNGNPLQYSCLENPMDRGAWQATVLGVARVGHDLVIKPPPSIWPAKSGFLWLKV